MLRKEIDRNYVVYPSWAELPAKWADLPRLLADPLRSGFLDPNFDARRFGYPEQIQPYEIVSGPEGGGIIMWRGDPTRGRWLPLTVLTKEANLRLPSGSDSLYQASDLYVAYLEPMGEPGWQMGLAKKPLNIRPALSPEHAESAGDRIYWVAQLQASVQAFEGAQGLDVNCYLGNALRAPSRCLVGPPDLLDAETEAWFPNPEYQSAWFEVSGDGDGIGYHFAVVVYIGNHLRWFGGPRMDSMHLVAQIEGKPNPCRRWTRKN